MLTIQRAMNKQRTNMKYDTYVHPKCNTCHGDLHVITSHTGGCRVTISGTAHKRGRHDNDYFTNSSPPGQKDRHFADDLLTHLSVDGKFCILIKKNSLKFVPTCPVDNKPVLAKVMAWRRTGDKPLTEPMLTQFRVLKYTRRINIWLHCIVCCCNWVVTNFIHIYEGYLYGTKLHRCQLCSPGKHG